MSCAAYKGPVSASVIISLENFMMIWWWEHSVKGVTDGLTEWTIDRTAWSQLKQNHCLMLLSHLGSLGPLSTKGVIGKEHIITNLWVAIHVNIHKQNTNVCITICRKEWIHDIWKESFSASGDQCGGACLMSGLKKLFPHPRFFYRRSP